MDKSLPDKNRQPQQNMQILLLFIKNPVLGHVKTRLAATTGNEKALEIYKILLEKTRVAALDAHATRWLWYSQLITTDDPWSEKDFIKKLQPEGDLGDRMSAAFREAFAAGAKRAVIIGSDCPDVTGRLIDDAFQRLESGINMVLGPTFDGGYYLLGMDRYYPSLFENINWSTETVFAETCQKAELMGLSVAQLVRLNDIDTEEDWNKVQG